MSGMGELHLEIIAGRLFREFSVETNQGKPQVLYRETVTETVKQEEVFQKELAGQQHFAGVTLEVSPLSRATGNRFVNRCNKEELLDSYLQAIHEGVVEAESGGFLMGYPAIDVQTALVDIQIKDTSDPMAFRIASAMAFRKACQNAAPVLLEPIMNVEVLVPEEFTGEVIGDLNSRQGKIEKIDAKGPAQVLAARVPLSKMFGYSTTIRSLSQGRGTFSMHFSHYDKA